MNNFVAPRWLAIAGLVVSTYTAGCEGDSASEIHSYVDSAGRSCTVDAFDISGTASCDADPTALTMCPSGQESAFVTNDDYDFETEIWTLESCAACVDRAAHTSYIASGTCANITCETDADCIHDNYMCMGGSCRHM